MTNNFNYTPNKTKENTEATDFDLSLNQNNQTNLHHHTSNDYAEKKMNNRNNYSNSRSRLGQNKSNLTNGNNYSNHQHARNNSMRLKNNYSRVKTLEETLDEDVIANKFNENNENQKLLDVRLLKRMNLQELIKFAENYDFYTEENLKKHEFISAFLTHVSNIPNVCAFGSGVLEILPDGFGFLRGSKNAYLAELDDIYVSANQINKFRLREGDIVTGSIKIPKEDNNLNQVNANLNKKNTKEDRRHLALLQIMEINCLNPEEDKIKYRPDFDDLIALFPHEKFNLEIPYDKDSNLSNRFLDIIAPIGKGQRALIVAPPKTGKTTLMKNIAHGIVLNHPEVHLIILLIDERPEEVTDMQRSVDAEVLSSTFDEHPTRHIQLAEMTIEKAKRLVETGKDVVILLDSITRLARAYNTTVPSSGKVLTGGVEANALQKPKRFFGAARKVEDKGSLTIIATALIDTGSKMDEVIFEEFKSTGNCDIYLDRSLAQRNEFPAIDIMKSGTRKADRLMDENNWQRNMIIRNFILKIGDAHSFLKEKLSKTKNNQEFYNSANQ